MAKRPTREKRPAYIVALTDAQAEPVKKRGPFRKKGAQTDAA
jgi:hypothetical protein